MRIEDVRITLIDRDRVEVGAMCSGHSLYYRLPAAHTAVAIVHHMASSVETGELESLLKEAEGMSGSKT